MHNVTDLLNESAFRAGDLVFLSGISAADPGSGIPSNATMSAEYPFYGQEIQKQTRHTLDKLKALLEAEGSSLDRVVKTQVYITDCTLFDSFDQVWKEYFPTPPPRSTIGLGADKMPIPGVLVVVDAIAAHSSAPMPDPAESPRLPRPLANYTSCVGVGDWLFLAGQLPTDFGSSAVAPGAQINPSFPHHASSFLAQVDYTIGICEVLLEDAGSDWDRTARVYFFVKGEEHAAAAERHWNAKFDGNPPPYLIVVIDELLTGGALIEIDVIASRGEQADLTSERFQDAGIRGGIVSAAGLSFVTAEAELGIEDDPYADAASATSRITERLSSLESDGWTCGKVVAALPDTSQILPLGATLLSSVQGSFAHTTVLTSETSRIGIEAVLSNVPDAAVSVAQSAQEG